MKMIKLALLGGAALAVTTAAAKADDLSALKAQIESLNARVATMEASPAIPAGYSLLTMSEGAATLAPGSISKDDALHSGDAHYISILPTADAPAAADVNWNGYVRAYLQYHKQKGSKADLDLNTRGQLQVVGKTDTAVGEVGVQMRLRAGTADVLGVNPSVSSPQYWGYWNMTSELTLAGGFNGSLGNVGYGYDGACSCYGTDNADVAFNPGDAHQMALLYASGPFSAGIAIEDASGALNKKGTKNLPSNGAFAGDGQSLGVAGNLRYSGDTMNGGLYGVWHDGGPAEDSYQAGLGLGFTFDPVSLSLAAAMGQINNGQDFWGVSALASVALSDEFHAEVGAGYKNYNSKNVNANGVGTQDDEMGVLAGLYYTPVEQLTIGLEGEYRDHRSANPGKAAGDEVYVDFVSVWSF